MISGTRLTSFFFPSYSLSRRVVFSHALNPSSCVMNFLYGGGDHQGDGITQRIVILNIECLLDKNYIIL